MNIQLIKGQFSGLESIDLLTEIINAKIKFHENRIDKSSSEEDIKMRENKIKHLQNSLSDVRKWVHSEGKQISIESIINLH